MVELPNNLIHHQSSKIIFGKFDSFYLRGETNNMHFALRSYSKCYTLLCTILLAIAPFTSNLQASPQSNILLPNIGYTPSSVLSPENEQRIARSFLTHAYRELPIVQDPIIEHWVYRHLRSLAAYSLDDANITLLLIDDSSLNAFAAPGKIIGIHLGLFSYATNIHEYSSVIAHELAHLSQEHFAQLLHERKQLTLPYLISMLTAAAVAATVGAPDVGVAAIASIQTGFQAHHLQYNRQKELEADTVALQTIAKTKYNPSAFIDMFQHMQAISRHQKNIPLFLRTHPLSYERIANIKNQVSQLPLKPYYPISLDYQLARSKILYTYFNRIPTQKLNDLAITQSSYHEEINRYNYALQYMIQQQYDEAITLLYQLYINRPEKLIYVSTLVEAYKANQQLDKAIDLLRQFLLINTRNAPASLLLAKALVQYQQPKTAEAILFDFMQDPFFSRSPAFWHQLSETSGLAGNPLGLHTARAEYFAILGDKLQAKKHLEYSLSFLSDDMALQRQQTLYRIQQLESQQ